jgi:hypothetical protein
MEIAALIISLLALIISFGFSFFTYITNRFNKFNDHIAEIDTIIINHPELFYIYDDTELEKRMNDPLFYNKMAAFIYFHFNIFENTYLQFLSKKTLFFKSQKNAWKNLIILLFKTKLVNKLWELDRDLYDANFVKYVNKIKK